MMKLLDKPISALCFIARPSPAFGDGPSDGPEEVIPAAGSVQPDEPPDFSFIERVEAGEAAFDEAKPKPKEEEAPKPKETPKEEAPKVEEVKPVETKETPKPKEEATTKVEGVVPKKPDEPPVLPTDEELDKLQPKPGASSKAMADFNKVKDHAKMAIGRVKALEAENAELKKKAETTVTELPEDVKQKLARADEDRKIAEMFELDNDPVLKADFEKILAASDEALFTKLKALGLPETAEDGKISIANLKAQGLDSSEAKADLKAVLDQVSKFPDPLAHPSLVKALADRKAVQDGKVAKVEELRGNRDAFFKQREEKTKQEQEQWGKAADAHLLKIYDPKNDIWGNNMEIKDGMTAAEKTAAEAHNKALQEVTIPTMRSLIGALHGRDPEKTIEAVYKAMRHDWLAKEFEAYKAGAEKEKTEAAKRIEELTKTAAGVRRVSSAPSGDSLPPDAAGVPAIDASSDDAIDAFRREKGLA